MQRFAKISSILLSCLSLLFHTSTMAQKTYYDASTGVTLWAPDYHSIIPNNGVFIIVRSDGGGVSMAWPFKKATVEQLKNALKSQMNYDGFYLSEVDRVETINGYQWGGYVQGRVQGNNVYGYKSAIFDPASGGGAIWLHYYDYTHSLHVAREAAIERAQMLQFDRPVKAKPASSLPSRSPGDGGKAKVTRNKCTGCAGAGGNLCYSCQGAGSKKYTNFRVTTRGTVMETQTITCYMCLGTGKIKCTSCNGLGMEKE